MSIENIANEFDSMIPVIKADYIDYVTRNVNRLIETYTPVELRNLYGKWGYDADSYRALRAFIKRDAPANEYSYRVNDTVPYILNVERLETMAQEYAENQVASFKHKLTQKLVDLENVRDLKISGSNFVFKGDFKGQNVVVEQTTVFKVSSKGTPFNQWPARIYLDGKFISEAKFKKLA